MRGWARDAARTRADVAGVESTRPLHARFRWRVLSVVLSIEPGRSRHRRIAKAANRAIHLSFAASCRDSDPYVGA